MEIKDIIKEELQELLKEGYVMEHDNFKFREKIEDCTFYNYQSFSNDFDVRINESDIVINWRIGFWLNEKGIDNFLVQADSVEGTYHVELLNKQSDEVEQEMDKNITEKEGEWKFEIPEMNLKKGEGMYVKSLAFDFKTKICTVNFYPINY